MGGSEVLLFWFTLFSYFIGGIGAIVFHQKARAANRMAHICSMMGGLFGTFGAFEVLLHNNTVVLNAWQVSQVFHLSFRVDSLSAFFWLVISIVAVAVSIYSIGYVTEYEQQKNMGLLGSGLNLFLLSMVAVVTANDIFSFLLCWELMSIVSFLLVMLEHEKNSVRRAGFVYVTMTHFGTAFIILAFLIMAFYTGGQDFGVLGNSSAQLSATMKNLVFLFAFIGFGTKAGMIPLHVWLPRAHPAAPSHISALMSAVMIKTAVYGLIRVCYDFLGGGPAWWGGLVLAVGVVSALLGILYGLVENDMKRFLAYSSTENMGIILMGFGASLLFNTYHYPVLGALALLAALYHVINHAIFKGLLFMGAGAVIYATHTKNINELGGLIRKMPWTAGLFLVGAMALSALPPWNGFMSEWVTFQSLLHLAFDLNSPLWKVVGGVSVAALGLTGALAAGGIIKQFGTAFLAIPRTKRVEKATEVPISMRMGMGVLAFFSFIFGVWPGLAILLTKHVVGRYFEPEFSGNALHMVPFANRPSGAVSLGGIFLAILLLFLVAYLFLRLRYGKSRNQIDETWNCGTTLQSYMEYTGTSFSHPLLMIFKWLYRPQRNIQIRAEYPYYPKRLDHRLRIHSVLESKLYQPAVNFAVSLSQKLRAIQNGNLQSYLVYMIATLILLLLWVR